MAESASHLWTVDEFFAWQERQPERYELVGGFPLKMAYRSNLHCDIVVNCLVALRIQLRLRPMRVFSGEGSMETLLGQIRRPDVGIDCGRRDPYGFKAAEPRLVFEVLSSGTRDLDMFEKTGEYKRVETLDHIIYADPDAPLVTHWSRERDNGRAWTRKDHLGLEGSVNLSGVGATLALRDLYEGIAFPTSLQSISRN